jgi:hypothetical protein
MDRSQLFRAALMAAPLLTLAASAHASPSFPSVVRDELSLDTAPTCALCHTTPTGGFGTAETPFAVYARSRGVKAGDAESLKNALRAAEAEQHDSDDDGASDIDELMNGDDPNLPGAGVAAPQFGCSAGTRRSGGGVTGLLALAFAVAKLRRSRTRRR